MGNDFIPLEALDLQMKQYTSLGCSKPLIHHRFSPEQKENYRNENIACLITDFGLVDLA
jgi:hypothetical protein